jgi:hypothetical protein
MGVQILPILLLPSIQIPTVSVSPAAPSICPGGSATITASGAGSYSWSHSLGLNATQNVSPGVYNHIHCNRIIIRLHWHGIGHCHGEPKPNESAFRRLLQQFVLVVQPQLLPLVQVHIRGVIVLGQTHHKM